jgi:hypothetical protein
MNSRNRAIACEVAADDVVHASGTVAVNAPPESEAICAYHVGAIWRITRANGLGFRFNPGRFRLALALTFSCLA